MSTGPASLSRQSNEMRCRVGSHWHFQSTSATIKRVRLPRGQAIPEVSTSVCLISDPSQSLPLSSSFPSPPSPWTCSQETSRCQLESLRSSAMSPQRGVQMNRPVILWHDKLSRLIICLSLMVWQLIKALQGCPFCSVSLFLCSNSVARPLISGSIPRTMRLTGQAPSWSKAGTSSHSCTGVSSQNKAGEDGFSTPELWFHSAVQLHTELTVRNKGEKDDCKSSYFPCKRLYFLIWKEWQCHKLTTFWFRAELVWQSVYGVNVLVILNGAAPECTTSLCAEEKKK